MRWLIATALALMCVSAQAADTGREAEHNARTVLAFNDLVFNQHDAASAYRRYASPDFHHHAQWAQKGSTPQQIVAHNIEAFARMAQQFPKSHREVKQVIAAGDLVVLHSLALDGAGVGETVTNLKKGGEQAPKSGDEVVDIYRLSAGRIVEHWEVSQLTTSLDDVF